MREGKGRKRDMAYLRPQLAPPTNARPTAHSYIGAKWSIKQRREGGEHFLTSRPTERVVDVAVR